MHIPNVKLNTQASPETAFSVVINRDIRISGLLAFLAPEDLQTLVAILTFVDESGRCELSARAMGQALDLSEKRAQIRLRKLCGITWHGKPLLMRENQREAGRFQPTGYRLPEVAGVKVLPDGVPQISMPDGGSSSGRGSESGSRELDVGILPRPGGDAGIRKRMSTSGAPGTDVEGIPPANTPITGNSCVVAGNINKEHTAEDRDGAADTDKRKRILRELLRYGVSGSTASQMLDKYPIERISGQLDMLPFRNAKEPAAMLIKAIKEDWTAPAAYMGRQRKEAEQKAKIERESVEAEKQRTWHKRVEAAKGKLSHEELQRITRTAREEMQKRLGTAFHGDVPERLVKIEVNRIISKKYANHD